MLQSNLKFDSPSAYRSSAVASGSGGLGLAEGAGLAVTRAVGEMVGVRVVVSAKVALIGTVAVKVAVGLGVSVSAVVGVGGGEVAVGTSVGVEVGGGASTVGVTGVGVAGDSKSPEVALESSRHRRAVTNTAASNRGASLSADLISRRFL